MDFMRFNQSTNTALLPHTTSSNEDISSKSQTFTAAYTCQRNERDLRGRLWVFCSRNSGKFIGRNLLSTLIYCSSTIPGGTQRWFLIRYTRSVVVITERWQYATQKKRLKEKCEFHRIYIEVNLYHTDVYYFYFIFLTFVLLFASRRRY